MAARALASTASQRVVAHAQVHRRALHGSAACLSDAKPASAGGDVDILDPTVGLSEDAMQYYKVAKDVRKRGCARAATGQLNPAKLRRDGPLTSWVSCRRIAHCSLPTLRWRPTPPSGTRSTSSLRRRCGLQPAWGLAACTSSQSPAVRGQDGICPPILARRVPRSTHADQWKCACVAAV